MTTDAWVLRSMTCPSETDFDALFLAHYDGIYRLLYRIVGTREEAEDLAQEAFLRMARQRFPTGREHNVRAWLYKVATNLAYNALRSEARRARRQEQLLLCQGDLATDIDTVEAAARSDERAAVRQALTTLPERQSRLLLLRQSGLSYRELAAAVGVAPGSVGTLLARAEAAFIKAYRDTREGGEHAM